MILKQKFFNRPTLKVAEDLLGKFLVRKIGNRERALMITEVEAYDGPHDKASHAHKGRTKRAEVMFGEAGRWYVYLVYGMHYMLNIVTGPKNYPAAILIRGAIRCSQGRSLTWSRSVLDQVKGPGKLTKFLKIDKKFNGKIAESPSPRACGASVSRRKTGLWLEDRGIKINKENIKRTPRIGVNYAGKIWANKPYRFFLTIFDK